jgi:hypothetical protein
MHRRFSAPPAALAVTGALAAFSITACARQDDAADREGTWVGTIATEGNVTTVVNEAGSVWGGSATLVPEVSIGVEAGDDAYMFGAVRALYLTEDRVYVVDSQVPAVRAYDYDGTFVRAYGGEGQGPGEYTRPDTVAADAAGRVYVLDARLRRINVYAPTGEAVDTWSFETSSIFGGRMFPLADGTIWKAVDAPADAPLQIGERRLGAQAVGSTGAQDVMWAPDIDYERSTFESPIGDRWATPYAPRSYSSPAPGGKLVYGVSDRYRFAVLERDGSRRIVERYWDPVPVPPQHKEWERRLTVASTRAATAGRAADATAFDLDGSLIPDHKPAYRGFIPTPTGEIWLQRSGPSVQLAGCAGDPLEVGWEEARENPCWDDGVIVDAFDGEGRFSGEVEVPDELVPYVGPLAVRGRVVVGVARDDAGTIRVKRYRLVLPGEQ